MNKDVSKSVEEVASATRNELVVNGFSDGTEATSHITSFLKNKKLKKVNVTHRVDENQQASFYLQFSFDGAVVENTIIRKNLKKH